ncbi:DHS-like NAD/FAD-binding domain-containing protein [Aspergillus coremiiformis]|uniref:DHS-like NAD/FAD-binding domain-containing protein n=1 Tax=Aspergillus coremiiformis TaxID=138285 RepID=A0A5N6ZFV4_9EURO|nr:DHS-like NAD/FAD-binding domain-containing protein [Aspergillus coremiiformis]
MAEGYAKATRRPGVVLVSTDRPSSADMVTPMLDGLRDRTPMVVICGQESATPETDARSHFMDRVRAYVKSRARVLRLHELPQAMDAAFGHATGPQPGPTIVDISPGLGDTVVDPREPDASNGSLVVEKTDGEHRRRDGVDHRYDRIARVADVMNQSRRPVICAGNGVRASVRGCQLLAKISQKAQIPVATTLRGLGSFDETRDEALHTMGPHGAPYANCAIQHADLLIVAGAKLDERAVGDAEGFAPTALDKHRGGRGIVHFDIDAAKLGKVIEPTEIILGDLSETLRVLLSLLTPTTHRREWMEQIQRWKKPYARAGVTVPATSDHHRPQPQQVVAELDRQTTPMKSTITITTGIDQCQLWTSQHFRCTHPQSLITAGRPTTVGFGLPAAIGAKLARPEQQVIAVDSDTSFGTTMGELMTALQHQIPIKAIVFNGHRPRSTRSEMQQSDSGGKACRESPASLDFDRLARSIGCRGQRCERVDELPHAIYWLLRCRGPALLDVATCEPDVVAMASNHAPPA